MRDSARRAPRATCLQRLEPRSARVRVFHEGRTPARTVAKAPLHLRRAHHTASRAAMANTPNRPKGRSVRDLRMVWRFAAHYPGRIACAGLALLIAAASATSVPYGLK